MTNFPKKELIRLLLERDKTISELRKRTIDDMVREMIEGKIDE